VQRLRKETRETENVNGEGGPPAFGLEDPEFSGRAQTMSVGLVRMGSTSIVSNAIFEYAVRKT
jgi:hypothetical protein